MKINILTLFPNMFNGFRDESILKRAIDKKLVDINIKNIRDYTLDKHGHVDDTPYGGGAGMLLKCEPIFNAINDIKSDKSKIIMLTPDGEKFNQELAYSLSKEEDIILLCGHYEGFDERIKSIVDMEISIGDYVLTGGELPAMVVTDSITRLIPGVIEEESHKNDSFNNNLLDYPQYTKPREFNGMKVPDILLSGDHKKIDEWRKEKQIKKTNDKRPDLINKIEDKKNIIKQNEIQRKKIGNYSLIEDREDKKIIDIAIKNSYDFMPKKKMKKEGVSTINKIMLVEPSFIEAIAKKNINKKMDILLKQISVVLNDETDDEGTNYVLGEIDRLEDIMLKNYAKYLSSEYLNLVRNKLKILKEEIKLKQNMKVQTVEYERGRHL